MKTGLYTLFICTLNITFIHAQISKPYTTFTIEGKIVDAISIQPIPFVSISILKTNKGTVSNNQGFYSITAASAKDSLNISFVGYISQHVAVKDLKNTDTIFLEPKMVLLTEYSFTEKDTYLYKMLSSCKKNAKGKAKIAKTYFELATSINNQQVELIECFYNGSYSGDQINHVDLKEGRIAISKFNQTYFVSTESSKAVYTFKLFEHNEFFPKNPFELNIHNLRKYYRLYLVKRFHDEQSNPIYMVDFNPKDTIGHFFKGTAWIDSVNNKVIKVHLKVLHAAEHPFLPVFATDSIVQTDLEITKTFIPGESALRFDYINFQYQLKYRERNGTIFNVNTDAIMYAYDYESSFDLPFFKFAEGTHSDYWKINAVPYNNFFWENINEFRLNDKKNQNESFFKTNEKVNNNRLPTESKSFKTMGFFQHPYIIWNGERISFKESAEDSINKKELAANIPSDLYHIEIQLYMDVNYLNDSLNIITATIFDPFQTYFKFPIDNKAHCFLSIYFDIVEIERRALESEIQQAHYTIDSLKSIYERKTRELKKISSEFFMDTERGSNQEGMLKWNKFVFDRLKIDNFAFFQLK